jgi:hypothetical protein
MFEPSSAHLTNRLGLGIIRRMKREPDPSVGILDFRTGRMIPWEEWCLSSGSKYNRRKGSYLPGWEEKTISNRTVLNRRERHRVKVQLRKLSEADKL